MKSYSTSSDFYPRPPRGGRPRTFCTVHQASSYFYPRPPRGGRRLFLRLLCGGFRFLSTPSARRATRRPFEHGGQKPRFLSTPSARRATVPLGFGVGKVLISIHALREEGDVGRNLVADLVVISIHALREEGDLLRFTRTPGAILFLSTPSARRATRPTISTTPSGSYFYPRPPRGGRRLFLRLLCGGFRFLSTPSARRATWMVWRSSVSVVNFYPRPPRGGRPSRPSPSQISLHFYPRPPRGGRRLAGLLRSPPCKFLSTPSARRATYGLCGHIGSNVISIHALREEGDAYAKMWNEWFRDISIHALREEGDPRVVFIINQFVIISIHALREEGDNPEK